MLSKLGADSRLEAIGIGLRTGLLMLSRRRALAAGFVLPKHIRRCERLENGRVWLSAPTDSGARDLMDARLRPGSSVAGDSLIVRGEGQQIAKCELASRQRAALVTVELQEFVRRFGNCGRKRFGPDRHPPVMRQPFLCFHGGVSIDVSVQHSSRQPHEPQDIFRRRPRPDRTIEDQSLGSAHPFEINLGLRNPACRCEASRTCPGAGDAPGQVSNLRFEFWQRPSWHREAVAQCVGGDFRLPGTGPGTRASRGVAAQP